MFFSTIYISTDIEDFQSSIAYFFNELSTNLHQNFSDTLFPEFVRSKLYKHGNEQLGFKKFVSVFEDIFNLYISDELTAPIKEGLIEAFSISNEIDALCSDIDINPIHYGDLVPEVKAIGAMFNSFYDNYFNDLNDKDKHFREYCYHNGKICPVCGLNTIYQYDHFLPKGTKLPLYPFSSVNPRNLIPICQKCNGSKSSKIILYTDNNRNNARLKVFSPFTSIDTWTHLNYDLTNVSKPTVSSPGQWRVSITLKEDELSADEIAKITQWRTFFNIENRFSEEIENCIKIWILEFSIKGKSFEEMVAETIPNTVNIKRINGILLQNLLFQFIRDNQELREMFEVAQPLAQDPSELLLQQNN